MCALLLTDSEYSVGGVHSTLRLLCMEELKSVMPHGLIEDIKYRSSGTFGFLRVKKLFDE